MIATMFSVVPEHEPKLVARFKLLRRLGFPTGVNIKRGGSFAYDLDATTGSMLAFALMNAMVTPMQAVAILVASQRILAEEVRAILARIGAGDSPIDLDKRPADGRLLVITAAALAHWKVGGHGDQPADASDGTAKLEIMRPDDLADRINVSTPANIAPAQIVIDFHGIIAWTANAMLKASWATAAQMQAEIERPTA